MESCVVGLAHPSKKGHFFTLKWSLNGDPCSCSPLLLPRGRLFQGSSLPARGPEHSGCHSGSSLSLPTEEHSPSSTSTGGQAQGGRTPTQLLPPSPILTQDFRSPLLPALPSSSSANKWKTKINHLPPRAKCVWSLHSILLLRFLVLSSGTAT